MNDVTEARWALVVRVLALASLILATVAILEAWAIRRTRAELQLLRAEREEATTMVESTWAQRPSAELTAAIRWLDAFYADPAEGLGRAGGLCATGKLDEAPIVRFAAGEFLRARVSGLSLPSSIEAMRASLVQTDAYRSVHGR